MTALSTLRAAPLALGALIAAPIGAVAEPFPSDFLSGTYSSEEGCASGVNHTRDDGVTYLDASGLSAIEYTCEFLHVFGIPESRGFVAVTACSAPGEMIPETLLVRDLVNLPGAAEPATEVGVVYQGAYEETRFWRCAAE